MTGVQQGEKSNHQGAAPPFPSLSGRQGSVLTVSVSFPQIHYQKGPESLCSAEGKMGAKLHFSTEISATIVTAEFAAQGHLDSALGPSVLGGA